jgi:hypothetical protein
MINMSKHTNKANTSVVIGSFYSPGYSSLTLSYFNTHLSLRFNEYTGKNDKGFSQYDPKNSMTTTVNFEEASYLYQAAITLLTNSCKSSGDSQK